VEATIVQIMEIVTQLKVYDIVSKVLKAITAKSRNAKATTAQETGSVPKSLVKLYNL